MRYPAMQHLMIIRHLAMLTGLLTATATAQTTRTWDGGGATSNASEAANWSGDTLPTSVDHIRLDDTSDKDMRWDAGVNGLPATVAAWTQTGDYTGTVTIATHYTTGFTLFAIGGNCTLHNGTWTHEQNSNAEAYRLRVHVGGDLTVGEFAVLCADAKGYAQNQGPAASRGSNRGASHGGQGGTAGLNNAPGETFGTIFEPVHLGPGSDHPGNGGGAIYLTVGQDTHVDGWMRARGTTGSNRGQAGGSIYLETSALSGDGTLTVQGSTDTSWGAGGGGRLAVILTDETSTTFGDVTFEAMGGISARPGAAGTVYLQAGNQNAGEGLLRVANNPGVVTRGNISTGSPETVDYGLFSEIELVDDARLMVVTNNTLDFTAATISGDGTGILMIDPDATVTYVDTETPTLEIDGFWLETSGAVEVDGHVAIRDGGGLSHLYNLPTVINHTLDWVITGDLTIHGGGRIDVTGRGYGPYQGPGKGQGGHYTTRGGSHGGLGQLTSNEHPDLPKEDGDNYGSIIAPLKAGSGGNSGEGGGVIRLAVGGTCMIEAGGFVMANGSDSFSFTSAGGSVYLETGYLEGGGAIQARGGAGAHGTGGGGRVAVIVKQALSFDDIHVDAISGYNANDSARGSSGTVYLERRAVEKAGGGEVILDGDGLPHVDYPLMPLYGSHATETVTGELGAAMLRLRNGARVVLTHDVAVGDIVIEEGSFLITGAFTLTIDAREHDLADPTVRGAGSTHLVDDYDNILWIGKPPGMMTTIR